MMGVEMFEGIDGVQANSFDVNPSRDYRVRPSGKSRFSSPVCQISPILRLARTLRFVRIEGIMF